MIQELFAKWNHIAMCGLEYLTSKPGFGKKCWLTPRMLSVFWIKEKNTPNQKLILKLVSAMTCFMQT